MHLSRLFCASLFSLLLSSGFVLSTEAIAADPLHLSAMTFNLRLSKAMDGANHWEHRKAQVVELMRRVGADFIGGQEAWADQVAYLREQLPEYQLIARSRQADPNVDEAVPLLYRHERWQLDAQENGTFWLSDTPEVAGSHTFGNHLPRIVTWGRFVEKASGRAVYVYNTHLDHQSEPARVKGAALLARRIAERLHADPVVVLGDFNANEASEPIRYLTGQLPGSPVRLIDTFRAVHPEEQEVGTFHGFKGTAAGGKIDYVLTLEPVEVEDARILRDQQDGRYPSDHFPVTAKFAFPGKGAP
jgi:endonuclease/exonuclease/phosphatase family metal-dependent hydrolase